MFFCSQTLLMMFFTFFTQDVLRYSFGGNTDTLDTNYFYLNPENGNIILKRLLTDTTAVQFQVCLVASLQHCQL